VRSRPAELAPVQLAPHVHWVDVDGVIIILDERQGRYLALPPGETSRWKSSLAPGGVVCPRLEGDLGRRGWLADEASGGPRDGNISAQAPPRHASAITALADLAATRRRLRVSGFYGAYARAREVAELSVTQNQPAVPPERALERALEAFQKAERFAPTRRGLDDCLARSLALFIFLRGAGFDARHLIGVRLYSFGAHAWVETPRGVALDWKGRVSMYTPISTLP
jgi:Transglutaminase-like superfamily